MAQRKRRKDALTEADLLALFDEAAYLARNADVAAAVAAGHIPDGRHHFIMHGLAEGRSPCPVDRRRLLLGPIDPARSYGAEMGVLNRPTVAKSEGEILYVDHADRQGIIVQYAHAGTDPASVLDVDVVWAGRPLVDCLPDARKLEYVIASHVIEHVPDLLRWFQEVHAALSPEGQLRLAVPDRRFTFDYLRRESTVPDVLDAYLRRARAPLPHAVLEFLLEIRDLSLAEAWAGGVDPEALRRRQDPSARDALTLAREVLEEGRYIDVHCWVFTPRSFAELMERLAWAGLLPFACADFHDTALCELEFFVGLRPSADPGAAAESWRRMRRTARG